MKNIIIAVIAALTVSACLFSKKEEAPVEPAATEQAAPAAPAEGAAPAEQPAPAE